MPERQHTPERLAVVADARPPLLLEAVELHAVALGHLELRGERRVARAFATRADARRREPSRPSSRARRRRSAPDRLRRRRSQVERHVPDAERLLPRRVAQVLDERAEPRRRRLVDRVSSARWRGRTYPGARGGGRRPGGSPAARRALRANRPARARPGGARSSCGAARSGDGVLHDERDDDRERGEEHRSLPALGLALRGVRRSCPSRSAAVLSEQTPDAKKPPACGGAMMTWILSDSLSASVFWMSSGFFAISAESRSICADCALPVASMRNASASASLRRESASPPASMRRASASPSACFTRATFAASASSRRCSISFSLNGRTCFIASSCDRAAMICSRPPPPPPSRASPCRPPPRATACLTSLSLSSSV